MDTTTIRDAIDREAAVDDDDDQAVEPEGPEPEPEPTDEPPSDDDDDLVPETQPPADLAAIEAAYKKIETKASSYAKAQLAQLEDTGAPWQPCPCCQVPGFVMPFQEFSDDDQERRLAIMSYLGEGVPTYVDAPDVEACEACDALGMVKTGSKAPGHETKLCATCGGNGYCPKGTQHAAPTGQLAAVPAANGAELSVVPDGVPDVWGRPQGHPHYGQVPALVGT